MTVALWQPRAEVSPNKILDNMCRILNNFGVLQAQQLGSGASRPALRQPRC